MCNSCATMLLPDPDGTIVARQIDACMVPIIQALNDGGVRTYGCCCGHGKERGYVKLADERVLVIFDMHKELDEGDLSAALGITKEVRWKTTTQPSKV